MLNTITLRDSNATRSGTHRCRGAAMLLVMIALAIASIASITFLSRSTVSTAMAMNMTSLTASRGVAESGLEITIAYIENTEDWRTGLTEGQWVTAQAFNGGTFDVFIYDGRDEDGNGTIESDGDLSDDDTDPVTIQVVGRVNGVAHRVQAVIYDGDGDSSSRLTLVVGTDPLSAQDSAKKALAESWGWQVTTLLDSAGSSTYDDALLEADVVWVSEEVSSGSVGSKLTDLTVGLVNEENGSNDDLLLATSGNTMSGTEIEVINNGHYISSHLSLGDVDLVTSSTTLTRVNAGLVSSAAVLGQHSSGNKPMLVALEAYEPLSDGSSGAGRRVILPWGGDDFAIGLLNDDGKEVLRKSLIWASQSPNVPTPIAYWTLNETVGTVAVDQMGNYDGTYVNSPQQGQPAVFSTAPLFDDDTDRVELPAAAFDGRTQCSISLWVKTTNTSNQPILSGAKTGMDNSFLLWMPNATMLRWYYGSGNNSYKTWTIPNIADGKWHHMVFVFDDAEGELTLYMDGESEGTISQSLSAIDVEAVVLGEEQDYVGGGFAPSQAFFGSIDDVRLFDRSIAANEVEALYEEADYDPDAEEPLQVVLYEFDEPASISPVMLSHWRFDEPAGGATNWAVVTDNIDMTGNSRVDAYDMSSDYGPANRSESVRISTDETGNDTVQMSNNSIIDGDLFVGPADWIGDYVELNDSAQITGEIRALDDEVDYPGLSTPSSRPGSLGTQTYTGGTYNVGSDLRFYDLTIQGDIDVTISGDVTFYIDDDFVMSNTSEFIVPDGSSLTIYVGDDFTMNDDAKIHGDSTSPDRVDIYLYGSSSGATFTMRDDTIVAGRVSSDGDITLEDNAVIYGTIAADDDLSMSGNTGLHIADALPGFAPTQAYDDEEKSDGTYYGDATPGISGHLVTAASFDGSGDYIGIPHDGSYLVDDGCVSLWFRPDNTSGTQTLFAKSATGYGSGGHLEIYLSGSTLYAKLDSDSSSHSVSKSGVSSGGWQHVAVAFGGSGLQLFYNGALVDSDSYTGGLGTSSGDTGNYQSIILGARQTTALLLFSSISDYFDGRIDELKFFATQLTASQVAEVYAGGDPSATVPPIVYDTAGNGDALNLYIQDDTAVTWISGGGIRVDADTQIVSAAAASKIADAIDESDSVTVELLFTTHDDTQSGPATILHYGSDGSSLNVSVAQDLREVITHLSTATLFSNGSPQVDSGDVLVEDSPIHIMLAYDYESGEMRIFQNGTSLLTQERNGNLSNWSTSDKLALINNVAGTLPWQGSLYRVAIWDRAFNAKQAKNVYNGEDPGDGLYGGEFKTIWLERP